MRTVKLGSQGAVVSRMGLGCMGMSDLEENAAAAGIKLTDADVAALEQAVPQNEIAGERYASANMKAIDR